MSTTKNLKIVFGKNSISIFGEEYLKSGKNWIVPLGFGGMLCEVEPGTDCLKDIEKCILEDIKAGKTDQIDHVRINNRTTSLAFLEELIHKEDLERAEDHGDYLEIQLNLAGKTLPVRIYPEGVLEGTYTKEGEIV